jgi:hypothetical protein
VQGLCQRGLGPASSNWMETTIQTEAVCAGRGWADPPRRANGDGMRGGRWGIMAAFTRSRLTSALAFVAPFGTDRVNNDLVNTEGGFAVRKTRDPSERFWAKVRKTDGCWEWLGATHDGYGAFESGSRRSTRRMVIAHRWSYEAVVGPIPEGLHLDHLCRVRSCVNPAHLEPVTQRENTERAVESRHGARCAHPRTPETLYVRPNGWRECRLCRRASQVRYQKTRRSTHDD